MKITNQQLKQIIKEELEIFLNEANFDMKTGKPITDKGREIETQMVNKAMEAENKCLDWAIKNKKEELFAAQKAGEYPLTPEIMEACPHKADDESHRRLNMIRDRVNRSLKGLPPSDDDYTQLAKVRRRLYNQKHGLPPPDDGSVIGKVRKKIYDRNKGDKNE